MKDAGLYPIQVHAVHGTVIRQIRPFLASEFMVAVNNPGAQPWPVRIKQQKCVIVCVQNEPPKGTQIRKVLQEARQNCERKLQRKWNQNEGINKWNKVETERSAMRQKGKKVGTIEQGKWERKYRDEEDPSW